MNLSAATLVMLLLAGATSTVAEAALTVTSTGDAGGGTLRQAMLDANMAVGADTIVFNIPSATDPNCNPGTGVCTITPTSNLPTLLETTIIDGYTQPGSSVNTNPTSMGTNAVLKVELNLASASASGITLTGSGSMVRGLVINHHGQGVVAGGTGAHTIEGNFIGTNVAGTAATGGSGNGVVVVAGSANNQIGGTTPASRNLISGNGTAVLISSSGAPVVGTHVQGNLIGTNAAGTAAIANDSSIFLLGAKNTLIGGTTASARNVIAGNNVGIIDQSSIPGMLSGNVIQGNYIGVDITGMAAMGNGQIGINLAGRGTTVGGSVAGAGNVIAANGPQGNITIGGQDNVIQGNFIGTNAAGTGAPTGSPFSAIPTIGIMVSGNLGTLTSMIGGTVAGSGNVIAFNTSSGVYIDDITGLGHSILRNSIFSNAKIGINLRSNSDSGSGVTFNDPGDADFGANGLQNFPVLTALAYGGGTAVISGTLNSAAGTTFRVEFFSNAVCDVSGHGQGRTYLGFASVTTDAGGNASFGPLTFAAPAGQSVVSSTATDAGGNTSEFSQCILPAGPPALVSAVSRKVHGGIGTFNLPLTLVASGVNHNPATEPRQSSSSIIVMTFDQPIVSASVAIAEGVATVGAVTFSGNDVIVPLSGVVDQQYVTVSATNVSSAAANGGSGEARIGFLLGDVNGSRVVTLTDVLLVNGQLAQAVNATNYLKDVNASGTLTLTDKAIANASLTKALPPP